MGTFWNREQFKFVLKFSEADNSLTDYTTYTDSRLSTTSLVVESDFDFNSSQSSPSTLFTLQASDCRLSVFDYDGLLNPLNTDSAYYGYMCPGLKIEAYVADYVDDITEYSWRDYGVWYVSSWKGGMENGGITAVDICCEDLLSEISSLDLTETEYNGVTANDALVACLTAAGLTSSDYSIDSALDLTFAYTKLQDNLARTINDILALSMGYATIKHNGKILFMNIQQASSSADEYEVGAQLGALSSAIASGVNYSKVIVQYPNGSNSKLVQVLRDHSAVATDGTNIIKLELPTGILSIEAVRTILRGCADSDVINDVSYVLSGTTLTLTVDVTVAEQRELYIDVYCTTPTDTSYNEEVVNIDAIASNNSYSYVYTANYTTDATEAATIANNLKAVLTAMRNQVSCGTCLLAPEINVGDKIIIEGVSDEYDGEYALVSYSVNMGASYNTTIKLLKYAQEG